jgi:hypothetical protein
MDDGAWLPAPATWWRVGLKRRYQFARASDASDPTSKQDSEELAIEWHTMSNLAGKTANDEISLIAVPRLYCRGPAPIAHVLLRLITPDARDFSHTLLRST